MEVASQAGRGDLEAFRRLKKKLTAFDKLCDSDVLIRTVCSPAMRATHHGWDACNAAVMPCLCGRRNFLDSVMVRKGARQLGDGRLLAAFEGRGRLHRRDLNPGVLDLRLHGWQQLRFHVLPHLLLHRGKGLAWKVTELEADFALHGHSVHGVAAVDEVRRDR
ncbi:hypothetical protein TraAM80_07961 [Trypanosoma rangeli]|uniref:Uncharacterized protein n=1 Tax=Trypanosoma rangeli TaxID=5698 RepID=A0A422N330_TRYRA|nr:uncharacterized protein TraAM80_07961 [Trypanosoma rangeli]RNE99841.1 hypothetical protein TraAM80_07961 [Trypanosoma rangeli]|eukprot:RNE99841.1 hypothetical protein TraAM80_07961 [Trypanosoma rangeli]